MPNAFFFADVDFKTICDRLEEEKAKANELQKEVERLTAALRLAESNNKPDGT